MQCGCFSIGRHIDKAYPEARRVGVEEGIKSSVISAQESRTNQIGGRLQQYELLLTLYLVSRHAPPVQQHEVGTVTIIENSGNALEDASADTDEVTEEVGSDTQQLIVSLGSIGNNDENGTCQVLIMTSTHKCP